MRRCNFSQSREILPKLWIVGRAKPYLVQVPPSLSVALGMTDDQVTLSGKENSLIVLLID